MKRLILLLLMLVFVVAACRPKPKCATHKGKKLKKYYNNIQYQ